MASWQEKLNSNGERLSHLLKTGDFSDVTFTVGIPPEEKTFKLHRNILSMCSDVFERMFYGSLPEKSEVDIPDIQPAIFHKTMEYVYSESFIVESMEDAMLIYCTADNYNITKLRNMCIGYITKSLSPKNISLLYNKPNILGNLEIKQICETMISEKTSDILKSDSFTKCPLKMMKHLLQLDELNIESEEWLYEFVLKWAKDKKNGEYTEEELRSVMDPILPYIRFLAMTVEGFLSGPGSSSFMTDSEVASISTNLIGSLHRELPSWCNKRKYRNGPISLFKSYKLLQLGENHSCSYGTALGDSLACSITMKFGIEMMIFRGICLYATVRNTDLLMGNTCMYLYITDGYKECNLGRNTCLYDSETSLLVIILMKPFILKSEKAYILSVKSNIGCIFKLCAVQSQQPMYIWDQRSHPKFKFPHPIFSNGCDGNQRVYPHFCGLFYD